MSAGDLSPTTAKTLTAFPLVEVIVTLLPASRMTFVFAEGSVLGPIHVAQLTDVNCVGFDYTAGVFTDGIARAVTNEFTKLAGILFGAGGTGANARRTAAVQALITDGVITMPGTVG